jgi:Holliday junction resolvase RusA-like endonuclease
LAQGRTLLDVSLFPFEPHSLRGGRGGHKLEVKSRLREKILEEIERNALNLSELKAGLKGRLLSIDVEFFLLEGPAEITNTRFKKDLDNLVKPILDVLQVRLNSTTKEDLGLGLLEGDEYVCEIHAKKSLVHDPADEGVRITIREHPDPDMLRALQESS